MRRVARDPACAAARIEDEAELPELKRARRDLVDSEVQGRRDLRVRVRAARVPEENRVLFSAFDRASEARDRGRHRRKYRQSLGFWDYHSCAHGKFIC